MEKQKQIVTTVVETEQAPKAGYTAPQMFAVAKTVELIQGYGFHNADSMQVGGYHAAPPG